MPGRIHRISTVYHTAKCEERRGIRPPVLTALAESPESSCFFCTWAQSAQKKHRTFDIPGKIYRISAIYITAKCEERREICPLVLTVLAESPESSCFFCASTQSIQFSSMLYVQNGKAAPPVPSDWGRCSVCLYQGQSRMVTSIYSPSTSNCAI